MKKKVHIIVPDSFNTPWGGMGVGSLHFIEGLSDEFEFYVIGFPEQNSIPNYTGVSNVLPHNSHGSVSILASQIAYYHASVSLPKPDLVHVYDWSVYIAGVHASKFWNVPLVVSMRLSINLLSDLGINYVANIQTKDGFWINQALREMEYFGLKEAKVITQVSNAYAKTFESLPYTKDKTVVVPNGINLEQWSTYTKIRLPGNRKIKLVYIGRIVPMKGLNALFSARVPDEIDLIFIASDQGSDPFLYNQLIELSVSVENIHFVGAKYGQEKIDYLNSADAVIIPSLHEPFGIVALEALASKSILLSSKVDGMSDFLDNNNSIFCGNTPREIESALHVLINMTKEQREKMIKSGQETCAGYTWEQVISKMKEAYYRTLLK